MKPRQLIVIQWMFEWMIPVMGFLYWKWDVSFILLFFSIDWLASSTVTYFKLKKRDGFTERKEFPSKRWWWFCFPFLIHVSSYVVFPFLLKSNDHHYSVSERIWSFLMEKEMGIPQIVLLVPLVGYMAYFQFKQEFLAQHRYRSESVKDLLKSNFRNAWFVFLGWVLLAVMAVSSIHLSDLVLAVSTIGFIAIVRFPYALFNSFKSVQK